MKLVTAALVASLTVVVIVILFTRERDDGCGLLDQKLGADARSPTKLLSVLGWRYDRDSTKNPHGLGHPEFFDIQHQALVRLLALQEDLFGKPAPPQHTETLLVDHAGASLISFENGVYLVDGSASIHPDEFDEPRPGGYFRWERFRFGGEGRLLDRSPIAN